MKSGINYSEYFGQIVVGLIVTIIGGVIVAVIIRADRFAPNNPQPTLSGFQQVQTAEAQLTQLALTGIAYNLTVTHVSVQSANSTATAQQFSATETAAYATLYALSATPTLSPGWIPVTSNAEWTPVERDFDGVTMVLVPAGCFEMGSEDGDSDERPVAPICFDEPFWIDKYEVTNSQYGAYSCLQYSFLSTQPHNCINWSDASAFCQSRDARLPTESEWEYSARGPDNLIYPWGNEFIDNNAVYADNNDSHAEGVGSHLEGASWVGALNMSGNLLEWVSSLYLEYPYGQDHESDDGRLRVLRGGSFFSPSYNLRSSFRYTANSYYAYPTYGVRCARDFHPDEDF